jgi:hypothetical protein
MALSKVDENGNIVILPDIVEKKTFEKNEESHETLSKHDAYSLLDDVRAWLKKNKNHADHYCVDVEVVRVEKLDDFLFKYISDHFS